jgi:hypothetical protein
MLDIMDYVTRSTDSLILFGKRNNARAVEVHIVVPFIKVMIKLTVEIVQEHPCHQLHIKFYP